MAVHPLLTFSILFFSLTMSPGAHSTPLRVGVVTPLHPLCLAGLEASWVGLCIFLMGRRRSLWRYSRVLKPLWERQGRFQRQEGLGGGMKDTQGPPWLQAWAGLTAQQDSVEISPG